MGTAAANPPRTPTVRVIDQVIHRTGRGATTTVFTHPASPRTPARKMNA